MAKKNMYEEKSKKVNYEKTNMLGLMVSVGRTDKAREIYAGLSDYEKNYVKTEIDKNPDKKFKKTFQKEVSY